MSLREPYTSFITHEITVIEVRRREIQCPIEKNLARRRLQQIRTAYDFRDPHGSIVDDRGELIGGDVVPAPHNEIAEVAPGYRALGTEMQVGKRDLFAIGYAKSPVRAGRQILCRGRRIRPHCEGKPSVVRGPARPRIHRLIVALIRRARGQRHILSRARARINHSQLAQSSPRCHIKLPPLALHIRTVGTTAIWPLAPRDAKPSQVLDHRCREFRAAALRVKVFVAKNQRATPLSRVPRRNPECPRVPQVKQAGGRGRKPPAIRTGLRCG